MCPCPRRSCRGNQYEIFGSAYGAGEGADGASGVTVHLANLYAAPVEIIESEFPCRIRRFELNPDSGGAGEFRGGLNFRRVYGMLEPAQVVYRSDRAAVPPAGLRGGQPGGPSRFVLHPGTERAETMPSPCRLDLDAGTVFSVQGAGGGGYGDPAKRSPDRIARDLEQGYVTPDGRAATTASTRTTSAAERIRFGWKRRRGGIPRRVSALRYAASPLLRVRGTGQTNVPHPE